MGSFPRPSGIDDFTAFLTADGIEAATTAAIPGGLAFAPNALTPNRESGWLSADRAGLIRLITRQQVQPECEMRHPPSAAVAPIQRNRTFSSIDDLLGVLVNESHNLHRGPAARECRAENLSSARLKLAA